MYMLPTFFMFIDIPARSSSPFKMAMVSFDMFLVVVSSTNKVALVWFLTHPSLSSATVDSSIANIAREKSIGAIFDPCGIPVIGVTNKLIS